MQDKNCVYFRLPVSESVNWRKREEDSSSSFCAFFEHFIFETMILLSHKTNLFIFTRGQAKSVAISGKVCLCMSKYDRLDIGIRWTRITTAGL